MCCTCEALNEEQSMIYVSELRIDGNYYNYGMQIIYCPECGTKLKRYAKKVEE